MKKNDKTQILLENKNLFDSTLEEFSNKSYFEASTNEILKNSNYNKGSFYYRFSNKQELYIALIDYIIVKQIDLFNERQYSIAKSNSLNELLYELFMNLYHLFKLNTKYYYALFNGFNDSEANSIINDECLEPLFRRFMVKFNDFPEYNQSYELRLIIDNLYFHFPISILMSEEAEKKIKNIVLFTLNQKSHNNNLSSEREIPLNEVDLINNPMFFLTRFQDFSYPVSWEELFEGFTNHKNIIKEIKRSLRMVIFNYRNAVIKAIKSSLKNNKYLLGYLNEDLMLFIKRDQNFYYFLITCFYHSLKETTHLVIDLRNNFFSKEKLMLFYQHVLPILTKTSKIIMISDTFYNDEIIESLNIVNNQGLVKRYSFKEIKDYVDKTLIINYYEESILKTVEIAYEKLNDFNLYDFINNNEIIEIRTIYKISYNDVIQSEVK